MSTCDNCGAPASGERAADGRIYCCPACLFNPLGCRCKFGEPGIAETAETVSLADGFPAEMDHDVVEAFIDYADVGE